jgi:hypothetical protein
MLLGRQQKRHANDLKARANKTSLLAATGSACSEWRPTEEPKA